MKKSFKKLIGCFAVFSFLFFPAYFAFGKSQAVENLEQVGNVSGPYDIATETTLSSIAGTIASAILGFLGVIFIVLIIYAGFLWMTAEGNEDKTKQAKTIMKNAIIGLFIVVSVYAIWEFVLYYLIIGWKESGGRSVL